MSEQVVVVGVDGSPASFTGLRWALAHAGRTNAQVCAVRCWEPVSAPRWESAVTAEPVSPNAKERARVERELNQVVEAARAQVPDGGVQVVVRQRVACGPAGPILVAEADGAALLVVGSHAHRRIVELLRQSVSSFCMRHATCPVLVIPPEMAPRLALGVITGLVAVDAEGSYAHDHAAGGAVIGHHLRLVEGSGRTQQRPHAKPRLGRHRQGGQVGTLKSMFIDETGPGWIESL